MTEEEALLFFNRNEVFMSNFIYFLLGLSITLNIFLIFVILIALRLKFLDCGNIFRFFKDDRVAYNIATKTILDEDW